MTEVRTLFTDPKTVAFEGAYGTWLVSGVATNRIRDLVVNADGLRAVRDELAAQVEDAIVVFVSATDEGGRLSAFRSVTSTRDVFYLEASDGTLVLTDHYRNAVSQLDPADRTVDRNAVVDHLLFGSPVEPATYVVEIGRLGRGECLHWNGVDREWTRTIVDSLDAVQPERTPGEAVDELEDALADVLRVGARPDAPTMLSGGVDSTLLASLRDRDSGAVQVTVNVPEFAAEAQAGREAADFLDVDREVVSLPESAFLEHLEGTVDALGLPPRYNQTVFTAAGFGSLEAPQFVNGQGADALFGLPGAKAARFADWLGDVSSATLLSRVASVSKDAQRARRALATRHRQLSRPLANPESFAQSVAADVDAAAVKAVFSENAVRGRARRRLEYTSERASFGGESAFARQASAGHLIDYLCDDAVTQWRQVGFARGQDVVAPFRTRRVARTALAVPPARRYVQSVGGLPSLSTKYIPKTLLSRRLPVFPVHREKGTGALPIQRFLESGPLTEVFDRYAPPAFLSPESRERHVESYGSLTWAAITYAVWRDRVLLSDDVDLLPGTNQLRLRLPYEVAPPPT